MERFCLSKKDNYGYPQPPNNDSNWERKTLEKLVFAALDEQRARRRWGIAFKALGFVYLLAVLVAVVDWGTGAEHQERHAAMVNLTGVIESKGDASAENVVAALNSAFEEKNAVGVILRINSPGGSPVQAGIVNDEIRRLREKYPDKPLYAVVEDMCASGGYYVAAAADSIYVNKASIVGSIGVLMDGFGFTGAMDKVGVERRLLTAGETRASSILSRHRRRNTRHMPSCCSTTFTSSSSTSSSRGAASASRRRQKCSPA